MGDDRDGLRPKYVTVRLLADGEDTGMSEEDSDATQESRENENEV